MVAGDVGVPMYFPTNATITAAILRIENADDAESVSSYTCSVPGTSYTDATGTTYPAGQYAYYQTTGVEFPNPGTYVLQWIVTIAGQQRRTAAQMLSVQAAI